MARYNIKLDYEVLEQLASNCTNLASSLEDIQNALIGMENAIQSSNGQSVKALVGQGDEIAKSIGELDSGLILFSKNLVNYCNDMKGMINVSGNGMLSINTVDVSWNLRQMIRDILEFNDFARGTSPRFRLSSSSSFNSRLVTQEDKIYIRRVENKLEDIKKLMVAAANDLATDDEELEKFKKIVSEFENKDDEYRDILQKVYYEIADVNFWNKTSTKVIISVALIAVAVVILFVAPALIAVGGTVGAIAAAISSCTALATIATEVLAVGVLTATFAGTIAIFSGEDIEDAVGGGLFDGTVTSVITGGMSQIATSSKYLSYGAKILSNTPLKNNVAVKETVEFVMEESVEYAGSIFATTALNLYKGKEINMAKIGMEAAFDRGSNYLFKSVGQCVDNTINTSDVHIIRDGKLSFIDMKNAVVNGLNKKSVEAVKEVTSQVGKEKINNYFETPNDSMENKQEETNVDMKNASESIIKKDIKNRAVDVIKNYVESEADRTTGVDMD